MQPLPPWAEEAHEKLRTLFPKFEFNLIFHKHDQVEGACPFPPCRGGTDRFVVYENGNAWCRKCKSKAQWRVEDVEDRNKRQAKEMESRQELRRLIATCRDWQTYHNNVGQGAGLWKACGITNDDIARWGLGYCSRVPNCQYDTPSLTIPIFYKQQLVDIRHRLLSPQGDDKYRSHFPRLPPAYFNLDGLINQPTCYFVEGEKKAIVCNHNGLATACYPGLSFARYLEDIVPQVLSTSQELVFIPDPGSDQGIETTLNVLRGRGFKVKLLDLMMKPDDFILEYGIQPLVDSLPFARWY